MPSHRGSFAGPLLADSSFASMSGFVELGSDEQLAPSKDLFGIAGTSGFAGSSNVKSIDLRGRGLVALPALGRQSGLTAVDLSRNSIADLESAPEELPEDLQVR